MSGLRKLLAKIGIVDLPAIEKENIAIDRIYKAVRDQLDLSGYEKLGLKNKLTKAKMKLNKMEIEDMTNILKRIKD